MNERRALRALPAWTLADHRAAAVPDIGERAKQSLESTHTPLDHEMLDSVRWSFDQARNHPAPSRCPDIGPRFYRTREAFSAPRFTALYRDWKQSGKAALASAGSHTIADAVEAGASRVETIELGYRHDHLCPWVAAFAQVLRDDIFCQRLAAP